MTISSLPELTGEQLRETVTAEYQELLESMMRRLDIREQMDLYKLLQSAYFKGHNDAMGIAFAKLG